MAVLIVRLPVVLSRKKAAQPTYATGPAIEAPIVDCALFDAFWFVYLATVLAAGQLIRGMLGSWIHFRIINSDA